MESSQPQRLLAHCPLCHAAYLPAEIRLIGEKGSSRLFHCNCTACGYAVLAVILETPGSVSSVGLVTDLEIQDALRFKDATPITADECLNLHHALEQDAKAWCRRLLDTAR